MGSLAKWGAVAGAGKGAEDYLKMKQEQTDRKEMADIDQKRQEALQRMKQKHDTSMQESSDAAAQTRTETQVAGQESVTTLRNEGAMERQEAAREHADVQFDDKQLFEAEQKGLDRKSREKIATIGASARKAGTMSPQVKAMMDRFKPKTLTVSEATEYGLPIDKDTPAIYDEMTASWYLQQGNKYVLPDTQESQIAKAPQGAVDFLFENPQYMTEFIKPKEEGGYGYLPLGIMSVLKAHDMAAAGMTTPQE